MVVQDLEAHIEKDKLYREYVKYSKDHKFPPVANNTFTKELKRFGLNISEYRPQKIEGKRPPSWKGIQLIGDKKNPDIQKTL